MAATLGRFDRKDLVPLLPKPGPCARPLALISHGRLGTSASRWEHWSEEAYEGWGWGGAGVVANGAGASASASAVAGGVGRGNSTFGGMFRRPGVVFPIHPTGHMRLPRPKLPFKQDGTGGDEGRVTFVVQVRALSVTRGVYIFIYIFIFFCKGVSRRVRAKACWGSCLGKIVYRSIFSGSTLPKHVLGKYFYRSTSSASTLPKNFLGKIHCTEVCGKRFGTASINTLPCPTLHSGMVRYELGTIYRLLTLRQVQYTHQKYQGFRYTRYPTEYTLASRLYVVGG